MPDKHSFPFETLTEFWMGEVKPPIGKAQDVTPDDKLDWTPGDNMITLGNIFMHIAEASDWWISEIIDGKGCTDYTPCPSVPKAEIAVMLDNHWKRLEAFFARAPEVLEGEYDMSKYGRDRKVNGYWIFLHLLEHDIHHRSQINHYLRILGIKPPKI
ncbi:MAG: DinB family protein [candidate division Zixibacteria bacterium]